MSRARRLPAPADVMPRPVTSVGPQLASALPHTRGSVRPESTLHDAPALAAPSLSGSLWDGCCTASKVGRLCLGGWAWMDGRADQREMVNVMPDGGPVLCLSSRCTPGPLPRRSLPVRNSKWLPQQKAAQTPTRHFKGVAVSSLTARRSRAPGARTAQLARTALQAQLGSCTLGDGGTTHGTNLWDWGWGGRLAPLEGTPSHTLQHYPPPHHHCMPRRAQRQPGLRQQGTANRGRRIAPPHTYVCTQTPSKSQ